MCQVIIVIMDLNFPPLSDKEGVTKQTKTLVKSFTFAKERTVFREITRRIRLMACRPLRAN